MRRAFHALLLLVAVLFLVLSLRQSAGARDVPLVVAVPVVALLAIEWVRDRRARSAPATAPPGAERAALLWAAALPLTVTLLGIVGGSAAYTLAYLRLRGQERWRVAAAAAAAVALALFVLFDRVLPVTPAPGLLAELLRR